MTIHLSPGLWRRRGALPRPRDRACVIDALAWPVALRTEVLEQFTVKARVLARAA